MCFIVHKQHLDSEMNFVNLVYLCHLKNENNQNFDYLYGLVIVAKSSVWLYKWPDSQTVLR